MIRDSMYTSAKYLFVGFTLVTILVPSSMLGSSAEARDGEPPVMSVCDLFKDLLSFSGKIIKVHGEVLVTQHSFALGERGCEGTFKAGGAQWGTVIDLVEADSGVKNPAGSNAFDRQSIEKMEKILCFLHSSTPSELGVEITATFVGELRTRKEYPINKTSTEVPFGGFGHLGMFPAQLAYTSVKDITVRQLLQKP